MHFETKISAIVYTVLNYSFQYSSFLYLSLGSPSYVKCVGNSSNILNFNHRNTFTVLVHGFSCIILKYNATIRTLLSPSPPTNYFFAVPISNRIPNYMILFVNLFSGLKKTNKPQDMYPGLPKYVHPHKWGAKWTETLRCAKVFASL